jgi:hypothetical protein
MLLITAIGRLLSSILPLNGISRVLISASPQPHHHVSNDQNIPNENNTVDGGGVLHQMTQFQGQVDSTRK